MTASPTAGMIQTSRWPKSGTSRYSRTQQPGAPVQEIQAELTHIDQEIQPYGSFENTPDELLRRYALLLHSESVSQALQAGVA